MSVKVIKNKVFDGIKTYEIGDVIEGLSENDKSQLVSDGVVEYIGVVPEIKKYRIGKGAIKKVEPLIDSIGKEDTEKSPSNEVNSSEDEKTSTESEENLSEQIDPNSLALNPDDYIKTPASKNKKEKAV
jgi:hypothetical protein